MKREIVPITIIIGSLLLSGCYNDKFIESVRETEEQKKATQEVELKQKKQSEEEEKELYEQLEEPLEETVRKNNLEKKKIIEDTRVNLQDDYSDAEQFAKFTADILYRFYTLQIEPEQYYEFMSKYGSQEVIEGLPSKEDAIKVYGIIQDKFRQQNMQGEEYVISDITYDRFKRNAHFYRKVVSTHGVEYYKTIISKEKDYWKFVEDSPSPPFEEITDETENIKDEGNENNE